MKLQWNTKNNAIIDKLIDFSNFDENKLTSPIIENSVDESIKLLIKSADLNFFPSHYLLCLISIVEFGSDLKDILNGLSEYQFFSRELFNSISKIFKYEGLENIEKFEKFYSTIHDIDYIYNFNEHVFRYIDLTFWKSIHKNRIEEKTGEDINSDFYEGFGKDLLNEW